ncbi:hypothetical protein [uncultured Winogradskyella sp.]|uniref:hypothetical protein n=1 Tax=uncultured Winogradskyella sp. TaxID=395353 RepID=UPI0026153318|nr:hypothetical protein [uncultured Winogradskyella sp.]
MKKILLSLFTISLLMSCSTTKLNSYGTVNSNAYQKIKTQAELAHLEITKASSPRTIAMSSIDISGISGTELIIEQLLKLPDYLGKIIKDRKKKFTQTYKAKNTLDFETEVANSKKSYDINLPELNFSRKIFSKSIETNALELSLTPKLIDEKSLFVFKIIDVNMTYTKSKSTKKYPFVNLNIVIKCTYYDKQDDSSFVEKTHTANSIVVPFKNGLDFGSVYNGINIYSDPFKVQGLKTIEVEVTEINPYYLKLEEMETNLTENKDDLSTILTKLTELIKAKE